MGDARNKRDKFVKLANDRVQRALKKIRLIGNLSRRSAYDFTDDVKKIVEALQRELDVVRRRFSTNGGTGDPEISFD